MIFKLKTFNMAIAILLAFLCVFPAKGQTADKNSSVSLRANLLRWATLTPDIGLEIKCNHGWSAIATGSYAHWSWDNKARHYGLWEAEIEGRRYLGAKERAYVGAQTKIGQFNYKLSDTGRQGDIIGLGLTCGYKLPIGKRFALDFTIGAGYLYVMDLEKYTVVNGIRVFGEKRNKGYWGITNLGLVMSYEI